ncbi:MAG: GTP pyrophosphokinase [Romboutsia sp.]|uniref:GTP pyrophosphokinase n=1 Tax=Romboutsia sp. TaxID=1965302 RepID=UPI003F41623C
MSLKEFEFIDESIEMLESMTPTLELISEELRKYFEYILQDKNQEYINISSRVKSESSLQEKIIRNRYLKKYSEAENLIHNLSDLIGIRIECRFIEDENKIYKVLRRYFNKTEDKVYYYNKNNKDIKLKLSERQPMKQKNGFEIYRIDGCFYYLDKQIKFELQIKSLVNIFWSEIEHKIIYKNNTYLIGDNFLKDMMSSIKNNLTMIDNQLLSLYKNFETGKTSNEYERKKALKKFLAKITYDTFSSKMKDSIGFVVDFKKPCETIISYSFNKMEKNEDIFGDLMIAELGKLNNIARKEIDFTNPIVFEEEVIFKDVFCKRLGTYIESKLNAEFAWNLFFRILFEIEPYNNKQDFENFIMFIKEIVLSKENKANIVSQFGVRSKTIIRDIYESISNGMTNADSVEILYDYNLEKINTLSTELVNYINREIDDYCEYLYNKEEIKRTFEEKIFQIFE